MPALGTLTPRVSADASLATSASNARQVRLAVRLGRFPAAIGGDTLAQSGHA